MTTKKMMGYGITVALCAVVVWASNNVDAVEDVIG